MVEWSLYSGVKITINTSANILGENYGHNLYMESHKS